MNKKEVAEIRKLLSKDHCRIERFSACYVNTEKQKQMTFTKSFLSVPDEEMHKYCALFKKTMSGTLGKHLLEPEFPLSEEAEGGRQHLLMSLRDSELKDEETVQKFFDSVIEHYMDSGNYLIILSYGVYDIPSRTADREELFDASEYMYSFLLCSICPVTLSKPGLCYDADSNEFIEKIQDHMVFAPEIGFLFPAFNDRNTDIHHTLYYTKNPKLPHTEFSEEVLGTVLPRSAPSQKERFNTIVEETFGTDCNYEIVKELHENLNEMIEEAADSEEVLALDSVTLTKLISKTGATEEQLETCRTLLNEIDPSPDLPAETFIASNIAAKNKFEISTEDLKISIKSEKIDLLESRMIDGRECLIIPLTDEVEVNGIHIRQRFETEAPSEDTSAD